MIAEIIILGMFIIDFTSAVAFHLIKTEKH